MIFFNGTSGANLTYKTEYNEMRDKHSRCHSDRKKIVIKKTIIITVLE